MPRWPRLSPPSKFGEGAISLSKLSKKSTAERSCTTMLAGCVLVQTLLSSALLSAPLAPRALRSPSRPAVLMQEVDAPAAPAAPRPSPGNSLPTLELTSPMYARGRSRRRHPRLRPSRMTGRSARLGMTGRSGLVRQQERRALERRALVPMMGRRPGCRTTTAAAGRPRAIGGGRKDAGGRSPAARQGGPTLERPRASSASRGKPSTGEAMTRPSTAVWSRLRVLVCGR